MSDRFDGLDADQRAWLLERDHLWRRAHEVVGEHPHLDVSDVYHALRNLKLAPAERLKRGLSRGRLGARRR